ncbi:unnamed protein product [Fraxinus pennsylvanica]|uniref:Uncharacterized protein n=1 Tax=Fraxinus pennsylvanica TaxID=56036 RepID=A0AAD2ECK9_9LAMI|nr:unnamed protein product [Fraxinus pennsylvanica]
MDSAAKKSARFEAAPAGAELDMLPDSFGETKFFETSSETKRSNNLAYVQQEDTSQLGPAESLNNVMNHAKMPAYVDTTINNLLEETSILIIINDITLPLDVNAAPHSTNSSLDPTLKSKLLDDFDSWLDTI